MANLDKALKKALRWEGGFANDSDDSGGPTMCGVTIGTYREYCKLTGRPAPTVSDLQNITNEEIRDIADRMYWSKIRGNEIKNQSIANLCFDCVWGSGTGYIKIIQKILGVKQDGIFGPMSLAAMNSWNPQEDLFNKLWNRRKQYFEGCSGAWKYLNGWLNRLRSFYFEEELEVHNPVDHNTVETQSQNSSEIQKTESSQPTVTEEAESTKANFLTYIIELLKRLFKKQ